MQHEYTTRSRWLLVPLIILLASMQASNPMAANANDQRTVLVTQAYTDPVYGYQMDVPAGWRIYAPQPNAVIGSTVLTDVDLDQLVGTGAQGSSVSITAEHVKIQLGYAPLAAGQTLQQWADNWIGYQTSDEDFAPLGLGFTPPQSITVGTYSGLTYVISEPDQTSVREILLSVGNEQVLVIGIRPAESAWFTEVLQLLQNFRPNPQYRFTAQVTEIAQTFSSHTYPSYTRSQRLPMACPASGTNLGIEAPDSPITLYMPFLSGERWMVGGWGYFYGNGTHCNAANEYYSTDWNRSGDDTGAVVLPVADGTIVMAVAPTCPSTGYGCYVRVTHTGGVDTLYAHFSSVTRTSGAVTHSDQIGNVGTTGNSTGSHLHFRFRLNGKSYCYNNGAPCANTEPAISPQSPRPSPMLTSSGPQQLVNGAFYTSNNAVVVCYTLSTSASPAGMGSVAVSPIPNCNGTQYATGTVVQLTANPTVGHSFTNWSGNASGSTNPLSVTINSGKVITASFNVPNDDIANALVIASTPYTYTQTTTGATTAIDDPVVTCILTPTQRYNSVWYRFSPALNSVSEVNTIGSSYDTILAVWTGTRGALVNRACNDDTSPGLQSRLTVTLSAGVDYYVQVAGYTAVASGTLKLAVTTKTVTGLGNRAVYVPMVVR